MRRFLVLVTMAAVAGFGFATMASAAPVEKAKATPKSWNYELKGGKRVPKGNRVVQADGSWREEVRQGKCITLKEKSAAGEYKESRTCN